MAYFSDNKKIILEGTTLGWVMYGRPGRDAHLRLSLQVRFVRLSDGRYGVVLDQNGTLVPDDIDVTFIQPEDMTIWKGQVVFLAGMNGLYLQFEGDYYQLFSIVRGSVVPGVQGKLYFHTYLPVDCGEGKIVYTEDQKLE